jgi:hypothetical protein
MLLIKYENDVVPHSSVCPTSGMTVRGVTVPFILVYMIQYIVVCSMQLGLIYVGTKFSTSKVSNKGGKHAQSNFTLHTRCKPSKGGILNSK